MFGNVSDRGTKFQFPTGCFDKANAAPANDFFTPSWFSWLGAFWYYEDFLYDVFPAEANFALSIYDQPNATGTQDLVADATGGQFQFKLSANSQAEGLGFTMGDNLYIQGNLPFLFLTRLKVVHTMAANQALVWGLGSDVALLPDNMIRNLWFKLDATTALLVEADDNTTDTDDKDTGITITANTFYWFGIESNRDGKVTFHVANGDGNNAKTIDFAKRFAGSDPAFGANNLQPVILVTKTTGVTQPEVIIDTVAFMGFRS